MRTDEELMAAYVAGNEAAFHELFERYAPRLARVLARQMRSIEDANDLVQQTFLQLHRSRHDFRPGAPLRPWLFTIALNLQREHFRRRGRRPETQLVLDGRHDPAARPRGAEQVEAMHTLHAALAHLPADQREVIELHWFDGLGFPEIAELLGAKVNTVKVRAHRGYEGLRRWLSESPKIGRPRSPESGARNHPDAGGIRGKGTPQR